MQGKGGCSCPSVWNCLIPPSPAEHFHKPLCQWHLRGLQSWATQGSSRTEVSPSLHELRQPERALAPLFSVVPKESLSSLLGLERGVELQRADTGWSRWVHHIRRLQMTKRVCYLTTLTPLIITTIPSSLDHSGSLPSHLFSPHPLWSHHNPFHFLHCRQRFFNNANLTGSLLCSKHFNSFPLSSVPCGKSTCLWESVCAHVCVCVYARTLLQGRVVYDTETFDTQQGMCTYSCTFM